VPPISKEDIMWRSAWLAILGIAALIGLTACGSFAATETGASAPGTSHGSSITMSLRTVPTIRSITVSPGRSRFRNCISGKAGDNTHSTPGALGFPNGICYAGTPGAGFPVTITNTGIAADIFVNGTNATPSDGGKPWELCNPGASPVVACNASKGTMPGFNQYVVQNFGAGVKGMNTTGLTDTPACDTVFGGKGAHGCWAVSGEPQAEGLKLTGPFRSDDSSTRWTVTITWKAVPSGG
jgi:hypothetical protein